MGDHHYKHKSNIATRCKLLNLEKSDNAFSVTQTQEVEDTASEVEEKFVHDWYREGKVSSSADYVNLER